MLQNSTGPPVMYKLGNLAVHVKLQNWLSRNACDPNLVWVVAVSCKFVMQEKGSCSIT